LSPIYEPRTNGSHRYYAKARVAHHTPESSLKIIPGESKDKKEIFLVF